LDTTLFFYIAIALSFSAFFSGMEIAFISANKLKIELDRKGGTLASKIIAHFNQNQSKFISAMLVGNNIALVIYGILMAKLLEPFIMLYTSAEWAVLLIQTLVSTALVLVTAEFIPKTIFRINPNQTLNVFAIPTLLVFRLIYPIVWFTANISDFIFKKILKVEVAEDTVAFGKVDLDNYLSEVQNTGGDLQEIENEVQILKNALDFSNVKARECMIPRTEIIALDENSSLDELSDLFFRTGLSKVLIYRENIDNIIGYVHSFELFKKPKEIREILLPISVIPETMPANEILELLIKQKKSVIIVVDEFGGTAGIITLEDVVEEIFGDIEDEHDSENLIEKQLAENIFELSGRLETDYLNDNYNLAIPISEEYETLAGFIIYHH